MAASYQRRVRREAWATSLAIHIWLAALIIWLLLAHQAPPPPQQPIVLTLVDLGGPAGDQAAGGDRPAPKPLVHAHAQPVYHPESVAEPQPLAPKPEPVHRHASAVSRPQPVHQRVAATLTHVRSVTHPRPVAGPKVQTYAGPNPMALAAEERRREKLEQQQLAEAAASGGSPDGASGATGTATQPVSGGAVSVGHGASGDLAGRAIMNLVRADFPPAAEGRHHVGWRGLVVATLRVAPDGRVASVQVIRSSGDDQVDSAAIAAFQSWRFSPLPKDQAPVDQVGEVKMRFVLR